MRPLKDLSAAELSRLDALSSAGLLRQETLPQSGRMYRRSTLSLLSSTLFWDGQALDFTRLCVSQLRLVGDVQVLNAVNHPELRVLRFHAVPNAWPTTWDAAVPLPALAKAVPYPQQIDAVAQYTETPSGAGRWGLVRSGLPALRLPGQSLPAQGTPAAP